ncbi:uncharacterized protein LOC8263860 [Ricinus communis]|uniref:Uncharacterized protein n=1 Tax=Ricinus communis TaxID=3988 RepID=B9SXP5_RICCO|nr:uncharacterized protein LOC8263860 [Ricinus communis]EEF31624.1 conserved hypothetical protein [Ricinus communis]|eukprot:XP_002530764.1 uncharacterized protein LOC8263860 [Ricinus communis]
MEDPSSRQEISRVIKVLEALKQASHDLQSHPIPKSSDSFRALLELQTESETILSKDPNLSTLSQHLSRLKSLVDTLQKSRGRTLRNFLARRVSTHSISRVAGSIESEIQAWIDRESIDNLTAQLKKEGARDEPELIRLLTQFENRISQGFDRELQDLILKSKIFVLLEKIICDSNCLKSVREQCAFVVAALISFNKDVFVGQVLMGSLIHALVSMVSWKAMKVLCTLINLIKSPLVDEIESNGEIPKIISFLDYKDLELRVLTMDCVLEIGYFGRKEAIEAMLKEGLIKKLVELQRLELGGTLIDMDKFDGVGGKRESTVESKDQRFSESHPFASCVARFAVQLEVGEGLRQREKRGFKLEILEKVREASVSDAETAAIVAEVLWGSSP